MGKKTIVATTSLPLIFMKENNHIIAYTPALDISTCAKTFEKAKKRFEELIKIYIKELIKNGTLEEILKERGWHKTTKPEKKNYQYLSF